MDLSTPTILWRLFRPGGGRARAVLLPGDPQSTLTFFVDDVMDRAENYDDLAIAMFRSDEIKRAMLEDGWQEDR